MLLFFTCLQFVVCHHCSSIFFFFECRIRHNNFPKDKYNKMIHHCGYNPNMMENAYTQEKKAKIEVGLAFSYRLYRKNKYTIHPHGYNRAGMSINIYKNWDMLFFNSFLKWSAEILNERVVRCEPALDVKRYSKPTDPRDKSPLVIYQLLGVAIVTRIEPIPTITQAIVMIRFSMRTEPFLDNNHC